MHEFIFSPAKYFPDCERHFQLMKEEKMKKGEMKSAELTVNDGGHLFRTYEGIYVY